MIRFYEAVNTESSLLRGGGRRRPAIKRRHGRTDALTRTFINFVSEGLLLGRGQTIKASV